ncbi:MAG: protein kinase [Gemmatimonadaceae bacterium]
MLERLSAALANRYRLERELGTGGMATVYLARDLKHDRDVALKVMHPELAESLGAERFLREIRLAARLAHPHILPLFDSGDTGGALWYAMPVVTGESLRDRLDRARQLPVAEAVRIVAEVAMALDYAHRQGIVHRDIKPENILLQDGLALVADFGIGRALGDANGETVTQLGVSVGTPAYMSPEQAVGEALDGRSDLYALGCVLYECLVGEPPFTGPSVQAVIAKRFVQTPADVQALREGVPRPVAAALQRALQRLAIDRFETGGAFAEALRLEAPAVAATANAPPDGSLAVLAFENLGGERDKDYLGDSIAEEIINALSTVEGLRVAARTSSFAFKGKREDLRVMGERLGVRHVLEGSIRTAGTRMRLTAQLVDSTDGYRLWSERYDRDLTDIFAVQDEIAVAIAQKLAGTILVREARNEADPALIEAVELVARGRALADRRGREVLAAIACYERAIARVPDFAAAYAALGDAERVSAQYGLLPFLDTVARARRSLEHALQIDPENAAACASLALVTAHFDQAYERATPLFQRALALDPRMAAFRVLYAAWDLALYRNDAPRAIQEVQRAVADDPVNVFVAANAGFTYAVIGDREGAVRESARALAIDPTAVIAHFSRVWSLYGVGEYAMAREAAEYGMSIIGRQSLILQLLPDIFRRLGDDARASAAWRELAARAECSYVPHFALASAALGVGRLDDALEHSIRSAHARDYLAPFYLRDPWRAGLSVHPRWPEFLHAMGVA